MGRHMAEMEFSVAQIERLRSGWRGWGGAPVKSDRHPIVLPGTPPPPPPEPLGVTGACHALRLAPGDV